MFSRTRHHAGGSGGHRSGRWRYSLYHPAGTGCVSTVTVAAAQFSMTWDRDRNVAKAKEMVRRAAAQGADIVLLPELFETPYFCQDQSAKHLALARPFENNPLVGEFAALAKELAVALPLSFFERANNVYFNSLAMIDETGSLLGSYRKSQIAEGPGYQEQ